jgi:hypothetical protein
MPKLINFPYRRQKDKYYNGQKMAGSRWKPTNARNSYCTFRAAPLDGGYANTALHDLVELGLDVQLRVLRLDAFQLDRH